METSFRMTAILNSIPRFLPSALSTWIFVFGRRRCSFVQEIDELGSVADEVGG